MREKFYLTIIMPLIALFSVVCLVGTAQAAPDGSQRLRGLGDRVFLVHVEITEDQFGIFDALFGAPVGSTFPNCYIFAGEPDPDGNNWYETAFPETVGFWTQDSVGAKTSYSMITNDGTLEQVGRVTPAGGKGVLQIEAESTIPSLALTFFAVGQEIQGSAIDECPAFPIFTPPDSP